jgi:hypothetical protein
VYERPFCARSGRRLKVSFEQIDARDPVISRTMLRNSTIQGLRAGTRILPTGFQWHKTCIILL